MKPPGRPISEIIDDAMRLVRQQAGANGVPAKTCHWLISDYMMAAHDERANAPPFILAGTSHADMKASLRNYRKLLIRARREPAAKLLSHYRTLDVLIDKVSERAENYPVPDGRPPTNWDAEMALADAKDILRALGIRPTKTIDGLWHGLAALCFEARTGEPNKDLSRHWRKPRPAS
jgi:hypothetical protein